MKNARIARKATVLFSATAFAIAGIASAGTAASSGDSTGVTPTAVKVGLIFSQTGIAGSTYRNSGKAFQARIDRANAEGGVNGRKIVTELIDDGGSTNNLVGAHDLVENRHVFAVVNNSSFAFLSYRYLLEQGVPVIGGGFDGTYYGQPGNEDIISAAGNTSQQAGVVYTTLPNVMKKRGATKVAALAYGISASSTAAAANLQKYAVPAVGLKAVYTNTAVDFGTADVAPLVLGIKNSGADAIYLPMVAATNFAVLTGLVQSGIKMKAAILATGYGQDLLDQPIASQLGPEVLMQVLYAPVELKTKATKQFQADLKKYADYTGVPDYGIYTGYVAADLLVKGLQAAGKQPTRRGFIDNTRALGTFDQAGMACRPIDISRAGFGKPAKTNCGWFVGIKDGKFVPGKLVSGTLIGESTVATTTTIAAP